ncbi:MAG: hypothetical protein COA59_07765 [Colwellia sp.]|nr:MAG: hypothetical protein COA59_07765 [Colwellia sp.]
MNINGLSFNALPPIDLPFRFFITAPIFIILCAFLILFSGETLWVSRWQPSMLALTHGFTLGFLTMVMMGALLQLLPVIGGVGIARPRLVVSVCHSTLIIGILCLMANFIWPSKLLTISSLIFLVCSIGVYILTFTWVLVKKLSQGDSIIGFRLAMSALFIVLLLGVGLLSQSIGFLSVNSIGKMLTNSHALFGLVGWGSLLIISVSFQVISMFHVAPSFPKLISRYLPSSLFFLLIFSIFQPVFVVPFIILIHGVFALSLLLVISKRKRKIPDSTIRFWQLAALTLIVLNIFYFTPDKFLPSFIRQQKTLLITAVYLYFYLVAVIQGMLLKILPFLSYTHLQQKCLVNFSAMQTIPHMHKFLNKKHGQWLFYLHFMTGIVLFYTLVIPSTYWLLSLLLLIEFSWLLYLMIKVMRLYFLTLTKINLSVNE